MIFIASITFNPGVNSVVPTVTLTVNQASQNISNNTTTVNYSLVINRPSYVSSSTQKSYSIRINGSTVKSGTTTIGGSGSKTIASGSTTISHNADGTKSISFGFTFQYNITWAGVYLGTGTKDGSMALTTIPRATTPTLNKQTADLGTSITISMSAASSSFKHKLFHDFYDGSWTAMNSGNYYGSNASASLNMPLTWAERMNMVNQTQGGGRILCQTFDSNNNKIGEKIVNFTATVPSTVVPSITNVTIVDNESNINDVFAAFIQSKSKAKVDIEASGAYGSTIVSYTSSISGTSYGGSSFVSNVINASGNVEVKVTVVDSRGRSATTTKTINVIQYTSPSITTFTVQRCTSGGTIDNNGTYVKCSIVSSIASCNNKNTHTYKIDYRKAGEDSWNSLISNTTINYEGNISVNKTISGGFSTTSAYEFRLSLNDYFTTNSKIYSIQTSFMLMNFRSTGKGVAFGKASEKDALEVALPADFTGNTTFNGGVNIGSKNLITYLNQVDSNNSDIEDIQSILTPDQFLTSSNITSIVTLGNLRGGSMHDMRACKFGRVVTLYFQINDITAGGPDVEIFRFKNTKYFPLQYGVFPAFINSQNNIAYFGYFADGHFSMYIGGNGTISSSSKVMLIGNLTYISQG